MTTRGSTYDVKVRTDLSTVKKELAGVGDVVNRLTRDMSQRFTVVDRNLQRVADTISGDVLKRITELDRKIEGLGGGRPTKAMEDSFHQLAVTIKVAADALETLDKRTRAMEQKATTARANVLEQRNLQRFARETQLQVEAEKRVTAALRFEQRKQVENLKQADSLERIAEQANQQKRLARWQSFYRTIGQFGQQFAATVGRNAGQGLANIFRRESSEFSKREGLWRRGNQNLNAIEESGNRSRLNVLGRYLDQRRAKLEQSIAREQSLQRSVATQAVNDRLNTGVLGSTVGATTMGSLGGAAVGVGLAGGLVKAFNVSSDFAASMEVLRVASGATEEQIDRVREAARKFGNDVRLPGLSAADAADAFRILATSGIDLETSLGGAAESVLQLSRAAKIEAADAAKAVSAGINVFGLSAKDTSKVADGLSVALTQSGASAAELNDALKQAGLSFANKFREVDGSVESFQQLNGVLAIFAKNGLRGSDAGTSLKTMLQFLEGKSGDAKEMLDELAKSVGESGSVLYDADGNTRTFAKTLQILRDGIKKLPTDAARGEFISKVFGTDASRAVEVLVNMNEKELPNLVKNMGETGAAAKLASAQNQGYKRGLDALLSTLETISLMLAPLGDLAGAALEKFSGLLTSLAEGEGVWKVVRGALYGVAGGLGAIVAAKGAVEVFKLLRVAAMGLMSSPFGLIAVAASAIGGAIGYLVSKSPDAVKALKGLGGQIRQLASGPFKVVQEGIGSIVTRISETVGALVSKIGPAISSFTSKVSRLFVQVRRAFLGGLNGGPVVSAQFSRVLAIAGALGVAFTVAGKAAGAFVDRVREIVSGSDSLGGKIQALAGAALGLVTGAVGAIWDAVRGAFDDLQTKVWPKVRKGIQDGWNDLRVWIGENVPWADKNLLGPVERFVTSFRKLWQDSFGGETNRGVLGGILNFIEDGAKRLGRTLTAILTDPKVITALGTLLGVAAIVALKAVQGFLAGVIDKLADRLQSIFKEIPIVGGLLSGLAGFGEALSSTITAALIAGFAFSKLKGPLATLKDGVANTFRGARMAMLQVNPADLQALQDLRTRAAIDVRNAERERVAAANETRASGTLRQRMAPDTVLSERAEALARARLDKQLGAERAAAAVRLSNYQKVEAARTSGIRLAERERSENLRTYGAVMGRVVNFRRSLIEAKDSAKGLVSTFSDRAGSERTKRFFTERIAPVQLFKAGLAAARAEGELLLKQNEAGFLGSRPLTPQAGSLKPYVEASRQATLLTQKVDVLTRTATSGVQRVGRLGMSVGRVFEGLRRGVQAVSAERAFAAASAEAASARRQASLVTGIAGPDAGRVRAASTAAAAEANAALARLESFGAVAGRLSFRVAREATVAARNFSDAFTNRFPRVASGVETVWRKFREGPGLVNRVRDATQRLSDSIRGIQPKYSVSFIGENDRIYQSVGRVDGIIQKVFGQKAVSADGLTRRFGGLIDKIGGVDGAVQTAMAAMGAFFSGQQLSADGITSKLTGIVGLIGSIGVGFAVGGPIGAGLAGIAGIVGLVTSALGKADEKQKAWTESIRTTTAAMIDAKLAGDTMWGSRSAEEFLKNNVDLMERIGKEAPGVQAAVADAIIGAASGSTESLQELFATLRNGIGTEQTGAFRNGGGVGIGDLTENANVAAELRRQGIRREDLIQDGMRVSSKKNAERLRKTLQTALERGVKDGSIDAFRALDRFLVVPTAGGFKVVQEQLANLSGDQIKDLNTVLGRVVEVTDAYGNTKTATAEVVGEVAKAREAEEKRLGINKDITGAIKDQEQALASQTGVLDKLKESFKAAWREARGETGSADPSKPDMTGSVSTLAANARAITKDAREAAKEMVDVLTVDGKVGTLTGKLSEEQLDRLDAAQGRLREAWSEILAGAAANPELQKDWEGRGRKFLESMLNQIMASAREKGLSADDQRKLLQDLKIPEFAEVQMRVAGAKMEQVKEEVGSSASLIQQVWDGQGLKLYIPVDISPEDKLKLQNVAAALGLTLVQTTTDKGLFASIPALAPYTGAYTSSAPRPTTPSSSRGRTPDSLSPPSTASPGQLSTSKMVNDEIIGLKRMFPTIENWRPGENKAQTLALWESAKAGNIINWRLLTSRIYERGSRFPQTFAHGDIVNRPTLGIFGEAGDEVILPLTKPARMAQLLGRVMTSSRFPMADLARLLGSRFSSPLPQFANGAMFTSNGYRASSTTFDNSRSVVVNEGNIIVQGAQRPQQTADAILRTRKGARYRSGKATW